MLSHNQFVPLFLVELSLARSRSICGRGDIFFSKQYFQKSSLRDTYVGGLYFIFPHARVGLIQRFPICALRLFLNGSVRFTINILQLNNCLLFKTTIRTCSSGEDLPLIVTGLTRRCGGGVCS